jgi:hypothetical protein
MTTVPPSRVFIVPYRDRAEQKFFFSKQMSFLLEDSDDYEIYFVHQNDTRYFNRGAMKNIGFLAMKEKYPEDYQNMNFIFNDVDTLPFHKLFEYRTEPGVVKHHYGFETALGGIVVIKGGDFEAINGYPNYWGWGMEDACLQKRCLMNGLKIDRTQFFTIGSPQILQLFDGVSRLVSKKDPLRMKNDNGVDGIITIQHLSFNIDVKSLNPKDNQFMVESSSIIVINVNTFITGVPVQQDSFHEYDLRDPVNKVVYPDKRPTQKTMISKEEWKNIPSHEQFEEKSSQINQQQLHEQHQQHQQYIQQQVRQQVQLRRQQIMAQQQQQQQQQQQHLEAPVNGTPTYVYSKENAKRIMQQQQQYQVSRKSVNIGLGGVR